MKITRATLCYEFGTPSGGKWVCSIVPMEVTTEEYKKYEDVNTRYLVSDLLEVGLCTSLPLHASEISALLRDTLYTNLLKHRMLVDLRLADLVCPIEINRTE